jgi:hypothetical protein
VAGKIGASASADEYLDRVPARDQSTEGAPMETIKRLTTAAFTALWLVHGAVAAEDAKPTTMAAQQARAQAAADTFPPEQIEQLVAPIALYPDALLAQIFMAATYPLDIVQADRWLGEHEDLKDDALTKAASEEGWDPSVQALVLFPAVLAYMSDNLNWTQDLGDAVLAQQNDVMAAVQRLRKEAQTAGTLKSTEQQKVEAKGETVIVQPADPEVVYVPSYNPATVYGQTEPPETTYYPSTYSTPVYEQEGYVATASVYTASPADAWLGFGIGALAGGALTAAIMWDDFDDHIWHGGPPRPGGPGYWGGSNYWNGGWNNPTAISRDIAVNRNVQTGDINVNRGISGNEIRAGKWEHNPEHRGGVRYRNPETRAKFDGARRDARIDGNSARGRQPGQRGDIQRPDGGGRLGDGQRPGGDRKPGDIKRPEGGKLADANRPGGDRRVADTKRPEGGGKRAGANKPATRPANVQKPKVSRSEGIGAQRPTTRDGGKASGFKPQAASLDRAASQRGAASRGGGGLGGLSAGGGATRPAGGSGGQAFGSSGAARSFSGGGRQASGGAGGGRSFSGGGGARSGGGRAAGGGGGRGGGRR